MDIALKQRLIGALVLLSLAVIFLPSLFHRDQRVTVDTTSLIPPKPDIKPVVITPPAKPQIHRPAPSPDKAFQPSVVADIDAPVPEKPALNPQGLPNAWVVQVGSFKSKARAGELKKQLLDSQYQAYTRSVTTSKGAYFRVFVGPYVDKARALSVKTALDKTYKLTSQVFIFAPQ